MRAPTFSRGWGRAMNLAVASSWTLPICAKDLMTWRETGQSTERVSPAGYIWQFRRNTGAVRNLVSRSTNSFSSDLLGESGERFGL